VSEREEERRGRRRKSSSKKTDERLPGTKKRLALAKQKGADEREKS